jgi:hypothetical protein
LIQRFYELEASGYFIQIEHLDDEAPRIAHFERRGDVQMPLVSWYARDSATKFYVKMNEGLKEPEIVIP